MQVKITTANTNTVCISLQNVSGNKVGTNGTSNGGMLLPFAGKGFKIYANKYQAFITVPGSVVCRDFVAFGVPYVPTWLQGVVWEAMWLQGNSLSDTDTILRYTFRTDLVAQELMVRSNPAAYKQYATEILQIMQVKIVMDMGI